MALRVRDYLALVKPRQLLLLMLTMYGAYLAGGGDPLSYKLLLLTLAGALSMGGATALNMYLERDIDSRMRRTRRRPLPSGRIPPGRCLAFSTALTTLGVLSGSMINSYVAAIVLAGVFFNIVVYTEMAKRWNSLLSIVMGSVAGSMPALGGWAAATGGVSAGGIILAAIVFSWQPVHVAFLSIHFREDYRRAGIPVLPDSLGRDRLIVALLASVAAVASLTWLYAITQDAGWLSAAAVSLLSLKAARMIVSAGGDTRAWSLRVIKFASPLVAAPFILIPAESFAIGPLVVLLLK